MTCFPVHWISGCFVGVIFLGFGASFNFGFGPGFFGAGFSTGAGAGAFARHSM